MLKLVARRPFRTCSLRDSEIHELAQAVLDIGPHPAERLRERINAERLVRMRAEQPEQARAERRLHERMKALFEVLLCLRARRFGVRAHGVSGVLAGGGAPAPR